MGLKRKSSFEEDDDTFSMSNMTKNAAIISNDSMKSNLSSNMIKMIELSKNKKSRVEIEPNSADKVGIEMEVEHAPIESTSDKATRTEPRPVVGVVEKRKTFQYDIPNCKEILRSTTEYLNRIDNLTVNKSGKEIKIVNVILNNNLLFPSSYEFDLRTLKDETEISGNCLAIDITHNYNVPLFFDIDCVMCKGNEICTRQIDIRTMVSHFNEFAEIMNTKLNLLSNERISLGYICKNMTDCGIHVYYQSKFSVSHIVYSYLLKLMTNFLIDKRLPNLKADSIIYMPLPFSAKLDNQPYRMIYHDDIFTGISIPDRYIDFEISYTSFNNVHETLFMTIGIRSHGDVNDEWSIIMENEKKMYASSNRIVWLLDVNPIINSLKNLNYVIRYCNSSALRMFIENNDKMKCVNFEFKNIDKVPEKIIKLLSKVGVTIGTLLKRMVFNDKRDVGHVISLMSWPNNSFSGAFHVISTILQYLLLHMDATIDIQSNVIEMINYIEILTVDMYGTDFNYIFDAYRKYPMYELEMARIYYNPIKIFQYITQEMLKLEDDVVNTIITTYRDSPNFIDKLVEFYITLGIINNKIDIPYEYRHEFGIYTELKDRKFIESMIKKICYKEKCLKDHIRDLECGFRRACNNGIKINRQFAHYKFLINTEFGIFNTLTNTYCSYLPFIFFDKYKKFSFLASSDILTIKNDNYLEYISDVNQMNLQNIDYIKNLITCLEKIGPNMKIISMIKPGLINLSRLDYHNNLNLIRNTIKMICETNMEHNINYELYDDLFKIYNFPPTMIYNFAGIVHALDSMDATYEDQMYDLRNIFDIWCKVNDSITVLENFELDFNESALKQLIKHSNDEFNEFQLIYGLIISIFVYITHNPLMEKFNCPKKIAFTKEQQDWLVANKLTKVQFDQTLFNYSTGKMIDNSIQTLIPFIHKEELSALRMLFTTFNFNTEEIVDFLKMSYTVHQPINKNKSFILLIGKTGAGKTYLQNIMKIPTDNSSFSIAINLNDSKNQSNGPQSATIDMMTSYLTLLTEVKSINPSTIKILTGSDSNTLRRLYKDTFGSYYCVSTIIGASNDVVRIYGIDEAVRERLAPFDLKVQFIEYDKTRPFINPLWFIMNNKMVKSKINDIHVAVGLSNLQYGMFINGRSSETGDLVTKITNRNSKNMVQRILMKNNEIYKIIFECNIDVGNDTEITKQQLLELVEDKLGEMPKHQFIMRFEELFCINCDNGIYKGIGIKRELETKYIKLIPVEGEFVDKNDLINMAFEIFEDSSHNINDIIENTIAKYHDGYNGSGFVNYSLTNLMKQ